MKKSLLLANRLTKQCIVAFTDFSLIFLSIFIGISLSINEEYLNLSEILRVLFFPLISVLLFFLSGVYKSVLRFIDFSSIFLLFRSICIVILIVTLFNFILTFFESNIVTILLKEKVYLISFQTWLISFLLATFFVIGIRLAANYILSDSSSPTRVAIYGAGSAGIQLAGALRVSSEMQPVAFIDSDKTLHNTFIGGLKVLSPEKIRKLSSRGKIDEVLIAIPSASKSILRSLLKQIEEYSIKVRVLPGLAELASGRISVSELKEIEVKDLLGRGEVEANTPLLEKNIKDKVVMITGAGGSIGSEISRQVASIGASKIILLDSNEYVLYQIKSELEGNKIEGKLISVIANVTHSKRIRDVCMALRVDTIFHAAAYKHVPLVEENPFEGFYNNVIGTKNCLEAAIASDVKTFVLVSTDKAVRPTNIMGATKRFAEMILQSYADDKNIKTRMTMVRFGNVIGSSGSAIPLFQQQIKEGGPVTVTHPEVVRYFMSIPEAAELVIQAAALGQGGDVFVLDMGEPVNIYELAKRLINLSGLRLKDKSNIDGDIEIIFTGLRPGEKLYEELLIGDKASTTSHKQIYRAEEDFISRKNLENFINEIIKAKEANDVSRFKELLKDVVHGYENKEHSVDVLSDKSNLK